MDADLDNLSYAQLKKNARSLEDDAKCASRTLVLLFIDLD